jgi:hypothetical protein
MNYDLKIIDDFKSLTLGIFKSGFGPEKRRPNYLKNKKITSQVHAQFICNGVIEDEDQMPFLDGYIMDSDSDSDSNGGYLSSESETSNKSNSQSNSQSKTGEDTNDTVNKPKLAFIDNEVDAKLKELFNIYQFK